MFFRKLCKNTGLTVSKENNTSSNHQIVSSPLYLQHRQEQLGQSQGENNSIEAVPSNAKHVLPNQLSENSVDLRRRTRATPHSPPPSYSARCPSSAALNNQFDEYPLVPPSSPETSDVEDDDEHFRNHYHRRHLKGGFRPDLLHACSLILPAREFSQGNYQRSSPINNNSSSSDYAEIEELCIRFAEKNNVLPPESFREECLANQLSPAEQSPMGQALSLRRPRISLTWVLRDQQTRQNSPTQLNETKGASAAQDSKRSKFKPKNKDEKLFSEKYVGNHNFQEFQDKREPCKDLLFVCTPQKQPSSVEIYTSASGRCRSETRTRPPTKTFRKCDIENGDSNTQVSNEESKSLKGTNSEPSLLAVASEGGNPRRHRHRKRRGDRNRLQKFGYEIRNVDEFLSKCSLSSPGNIPVVLSSSSTLYQTRPGGYQVEISLPLGMVVNAVFKNQNWLYVQTPHAEEGYVGYSTCLPLGILPPSARSASASSRPTPCWETNVDIFPKPCGNMTDSEKEIRLRGGTRSDGARTPRPKRSPPKVYTEQHLDKLYLRAASQPKLMEKSYAQLKPTIKYKTAAIAAVEESVYGSQTADGEHVELVMQTSRMSQSSTGRHQRCHQQRFENHQPSSVKSIRRTLVAISTDYSNETITVQKGDIVTLLHCQEAKDGRQWFYISNRGGKEGFIPAEVAGHGFL